MCRGEAAVCRGLKMARAIQGKSKLKVVTEYTDESTSWARGTWFIFSLSVQFCGFICMICTFLCTSLLLTANWLCPPINKPLFDLCLTITARPNSEQTSRAYRLFLPVNPESLIKHANSNMLFFTLTPVLHSFHAPSHLPLYNWVFSQKHSVRIKKEN